MAGGEAGPVVPAGGEQEITFPGPPLAYPREDAVARSLRHLEANRRSRLLLNDQRSASHDAAGQHVANPQLNEIAAPKLAVDVARCHLRQHGQGQLLSPACEDGACLLGSTDSLPVMHSPMPLSLIKATWRPFFGRVAGVVDCARSRTQLQIVLHRVAPAMSNHRRPVLDQLGQT